MKKTLFWIISTLALFLLFYTRFINLSWGLPYPFHPDERNMADAIVRLGCGEGVALNVECFNPHFFAYGQFPLYLAWGLIQLYHKLLALGGHSLEESKSFLEAVMALRIISAFVSVLTAFFSLKTILLFIEDPKFKRMFFAVGTVMLTFSPGLIQFSHFGTTESLLMFFYTLIIYLSIRLLQHSISFNKYFIIIGLIGGLAIATKVSALVFLLLPTATIVAHFVKSEMENKYGILFFSLAKWGVMIAVLAILFSPYNFISFNEFIGSMKYESEVGFGKSLVFYTRQFQLTLPLEFHFQSIFPYVLGWPVFILASVGFLFLPYRKEYNFLRLAFLFSFLPNAFVYTKWTRFVSPVFPLIIVFAVLTLIFIHKKAPHTLRVVVDSIILTMALVAIIPGIAFLSIYTQLDVRYSASKWIYDNIPSNSVILSETANVVDLPIPTADQMKNGTVPQKSFQFTSFYFYDLDVNSELQEELQQHIEQADYIIIPSRRLFANHTCFYDFHATKLLERMRCDYLRERYPLLNDYYRKLFSGELGFKLEKEFSSYPTIYFFGKPLVTFPDEKAEETWTVFDHPVIRIFKKEKKTAIQEGI